MNFNETLDVATLVTLSGNVLYIEGHAGLGKTSLINELANKYKNDFKTDVEVVVLFGSVLKEGEIGGIPKTRELDNGLMVNDYTLHTSIKKLYDAESEGKIPLLFVDELNRSEYSVQQELMQILLAREINGNKLPESTLIIAAGNLEDAGEIDYQVNTMNPALKDRLTIIQMHSDVNTWLAWGGTLGKVKFDSNGEEIKVTNIHDKVLEFIATFPEYLHPNPSEHPDQDVLATPRSWEKASSMLRTYEELGMDNEDTLTYSLQGTVGRTVGSHFMRFLEETEKKLIEFDEVFNNTEGLEEQVLTQIKEESIPRLYLTFSRISEEANTLLAHKNTKELNALGKKYKTHLGNFTEFIASVPKDTMYGMVRDVVQKYENLFEALAEFSPSFTKIHLETQNRLKKASK